MNKNMYGLFIDGAFVKPVKGAYQDVHDPATGDLLAKTAKGSKEDVEKAVEAADRSKNLWKTVSIQQRSRILHKIAEIIRENKDHLARIETQDSGKPIVETVEDVKAIADQFDYFGGAIRVEAGEFMRQDQHSMTMILREPHGVVAQIIPWNFPFLLAGWKIAPALAAGNCIVIKPASETPLSLLEFARLTQDVLPNGVLNVVTGSGSVVGPALLENLKVDKIAFTGSTKVGRSIGEAAAKRILPASLELGGKSANIIFPDAPMDKAIEGAALAILYGQGQVCNAGSRLFVHSSIYKNFVEKLERIFRNVKIGDPADPATRMGPLINKEQLDVVLGYVETGIKEGARLVCGGKQIEKSPFDKGWFMEPTLFADVKNHMKIAQEEIFGPVLVVIPFETEEEVTAMANDSKYGLAGACWTKDINRALRVANGVETGLFWINEYHLTPSGTPFGGIKESGHGRENHKMALDAYSRLKTIYISMNESPTGHYDS
ncbi:aldehyde dehydrogenase family protein [Alkalibacter rhizosphaerae]|uniref:Aldehyde dehydrogenase family protein n=1 Tax=Alkalibacter rhizosphaerae TaxID=2815577 RepID=A0A974XE89_9FIRM|nr:aldehyde dehydrogenase family protein [Alkalibacter rhizosphaerae]QSX08247.1 aldehyde dehydrogenase family protein [Alkalibacter rhizosphaerae]